MILEREVVVISNDGSIRSEVSAVVARRPGVRAFFTSPDGIVDAGSVRGGRIVIIDDEGKDDAVELIHRLRAQEREPSVVYLATHHTAALERTVRRAGASFYAIKSLRDGDLTRVIEALLGPWEP